jgi:hypothetical protein
VLLMVAAATASPAASPNTTNPASAGHLGTACIPCPYYNNECVPLADCVPPGSDCKPFSVSFTGATVNTEGTSIEAFWSSNGYYATTYTFEWGPEGGSLTSVNTGGGTSYTISGLTANQGYELVVDAKMTCSSGTVYTASASRDVTTTWTWTVTGVVDMATPAGVSKNTPVYGAEVWVQSLTGPTVVGSTGSYSFTVTNSATSVTVCADAPGYQANAVFAANPAYAQCNPPSSVSGGGTTTVNLLLQLNYTIEPDTSGYVFESGTSCFTSAAGACKSSTGYSFSQVSGQTTSTMLADQASSVLESSTSVTALPPGCTSTSTCHLISFSGTPTPLTESYTYWEILPLSYYGGGTPGLPLSSPMQLSYYVWEEGGAGHVAMDAGFSSGDYLHSMTNDLGSNILDQHGQWIAPSYQFLPQGQWVPVIVDLSEVTDQTMDFLSVGFDDGGALSAGSLTSFQAYFADIQISSSQQPSAVVNGDFMQNGLYGWEATGSTLPTVHPITVNSASLDAALVGDASGSTSAQTSQLVQEFQVPNDVTGGSLCLLYFAVSNEPNLVGYQRIYLEDRTTGADVYLVGSSTSGTVDTGGFVQTCLNVATGSNDVRGDRVWLVLTTDQPGDGYVSYMYVTDIWFEPEGLSWTDTPVASSSNSYGYNGVDVSPLSEGSLTFPTSSFPTDNGVTYHVPYAPAAYASGTYQPTGSSGLTWTGGIVAGIDFETLTRGSNTNDILALSVSAAAVVGHGSGTNQTCTEVGFKVGYNPCLYVDLVRLGIAFACVSGCSSSGQGLAAAQPGAGDGTESWNLAPICTSCTGGSGDMELLDIFGIAAGLGAIALGALPTGGTDLLLLPVLLGAASAGISGAGLYEDMQPVGGSGLPLSGLSCGIASSSSTSSACISYGWWDQNSTAGPSDGGATMWGNVDSANAGAQYAVAVIAQLQIGEIYTDTQEFDLLTNNPDYAQVNDVYLVNVDTV